MRGLDRTIRASAVVHTVELHNLTLTAYDIKRIAGGLKANGSNGGSVNRLVFRRVVGLGSDEKPFVAAFRRLGEALRASAINVVSFTECGLTDASAGELLKVLKTHQVSGCARAPACNTSPCHPKIDPTIDLRTHYASTYATDYRSTQPNIDLRN